MLCPVAGEPKAKWDKCQDSPRGGTVWAKPAPKWRFSSGCCTHFNPLSISSFLQKNWNFLSNNTANSYYPFCLSSKTLSLLKWFISNLSIIKITCSSPDIHLIRKTAQKEYTDFHTHTVCMAQVNPGKRADRKSLKKKWLSKLLFFIRCVVTSFLVHIYR